MGLDALQTDLSTVKLLLKDEEEKKAIVVEAVQKCLSSADSKAKEFPDLLALQEAIQGDATLEAEMISGGKTNYSFKLFASNPKRDSSESPTTKQQQPQPCIYAKLFLPYALWDADRKYEFDMERAQTEYEMMQLLDQNQSACRVAKPFLMLDVPTPATAAASSPSSASPMNDSLTMEQDTDHEKQQPQFHEEPSKLILAQWSAGCDEQFANQHIDGTTDPRVTQGIAKALAQLNCQMPDNKEWNDRVRPGLLMVSPTAKMSFTTLTMMPDEECDALMLLMKDVGESTFDKVVDAYCRQINEVRECTCHGDPHPFNILVEPKPLQDLEASETAMDDHTDNTDDNNNNAATSTNTSAFGPAGVFRIVDWETSLCGPVGKDAGIFMAFPTACALCMAVQGHAAEAQHLLDSNMLFWTTYAQTLVQEKKQAAKTQDKEGAPQEDYDEDLREIYRVALGSLGAYLLFYVYILGVLGDTLPLDGVAEDEKSKARAAIGVVGLKLLVVGFDNTSECANLDLEALQDYYAKSVVTEQVDNLLFLHKTSTSTGGTVKPRRGSLLRTMQRRISDASSHQEAANKYTNNTLDWSYHKRISKFDSSSVDLGASMCSFVDDDDDDDMFPVTDELKMRWTNSHDDDFD